MEGVAKFEEQKETALKRDLEQLDSVALEALLEEEKSLSEDMKKTLEKHYNDFYELLRKEDWENLNPILKELIELITNHHQIGEIVIRMGMVPSVLSLLTDDISLPFQTQLNALRIMLYLMRSCSTQHVMSLVGLGIIPILFRYLKRDRNDALRALALLALINISREDDPRYRTEILRLGILSWIRKNIEEDRSETVYITYIAQLVRSLLRSPLVVPVDEVLVILPILMNWIIHDSRISEDALWSLVSLFETQDERILKEITNPKVVAKMCRILRFGGGGGREFSPIFLRLCDSLKEDSKSFLGINQEDLETLKELLHDKNELIRLKTCRLLSLLLNDLFGFQCVGEPVLVHEIMPRIIDIASDDGAETREQATICLFNFIRTCQFGSEDNVKYLVSQGLLAVLLANLADHNNSALVGKSLDAISFIFCRGTVGRGITEPKYAILIKKSHFGSLLKDLRSHKEVTIANLASNILNSM